MKSAKVIEFRPRAERGKLDDFTFVRARQRLNELRRLVRYRKANRLALGSPIGWNIVVSDLALALRRLRLTFREPLDEIAMRDLTKAIEGLYVRVGLTELLQSPFTPRDVLPRPRWTPMHLLPGEDVATYLEITAPEREECHILTMSDVEEGKDGRRRRSKRESKARSREANGVASQRNSAAATKPWIAVGISRATFYRRRRETISGDNSLFGENSPK